MGQVYIWTTIATFITALGIFRHGGFTQAHAGAIVTLLVLAFAWFVAKTQLFGRAT